MHVKRAAALPVLVWLLYACAVPGLAEDKDDAKPKPDTKRQTDDKGMPLPGPEEFAQLEDFYWGDEVKTIFKNYDPERLGEVDELLKMYKGKENELVETLTDKYDVKAQVPGDMLQGKMDPRPDVAAEDMADVVNWEEELIAVYAKYNPAKVKGVKAMLEKYKGKERTLIDAVKAKYSVNAEEEEIKDTKAAAEHDNADGTVVNYVQTLTDLFTKHNPAKIAEIPRLLKKYAGKEDQLLEAVKTKYHTDEVDLPPSRPGQDAFERFLELREHAIKNPHKAKYLVHHRCPPPTTLTVL